MHYLYKLEIKYLFLRKAMLVAFVEIIKIVYSKEISK